MQNVKKVKTIFHITLHIYHSVHFCTCIHIHVAMTIVQFREMLSQAEPHVSVHLAFMFTIMNK